MARVGVIPVHLLALGLAFALLSAVLPSSSFAEIKVSPAAVKLDRPEASQQLLITDMNGAKQRDATREAKFEVKPPVVVRIDADGLMEPLEEGATTVVVKVGGAQVEIPVTVTGLKAPPPVSFEHEIQPILTKARCNSGGCHGKAEGQNGFKLSLFGFDPPADYDALVKEGRGRRVSLAAPGNSLLLRKATAEMPHGGGLKIEPAGPQYIAAAPLDRAGAPVDGRRTISRSSAIEVEPARARDAAEGDAAAARDGHRRRRRTALCDRRSRVRLERRARSSKSMPAGLLQAGDIPGEAAILVRYLGHVAVCRVTLPRPGQNIRPPAREQLHRQARLGQARSGSASSRASRSTTPTFLRRVYLDTIGTLPTAAEARAFLADTAPDKRAKLVDALLERPEYADYWAMKWADILRVDKIKVTPQGTVGHDALAAASSSRENRPYDAMVREILTAQGPVQSESPAAFFKALDQPELASRSVSQLFLGVRIECAQCHHHPCERWGQDDYVGLAGFFTGVDASRRCPSGDEADRLARRDRSEAPAHRRAGAGAGARGEATPTSRTSPTAGRCSPTG